jgi:hypothetical protein
MSKTLNESELQEKMVQIYKEEQKKVIEEKWQKLSNKDKKMVLEMLKIQYPEKSILISEAKWYNTLGDIVGIFDPTGVVDLINGISYWRQGDKLFAVLSWISVLPYVGDLIAKPVIGLFKMGGASAKAFKAASLAGDAAKMAEIAKTSGPLKGLVTKVNQWGPKILEPLGKAVEKIPMVGKGMVQSVENYVKVFKDANKAMGQATQTAVNLTRKKAAQGLSKTESRELKDALKNATQFRGFRDFGGKGGFSAGIGRLWGNRGTRGLMRKTKWYLGLLDFVGIANFVGPDDLESQVPDLAEKMKQYNQTPQAMENWNADMGTEAVKPKDQSFFAAPADGIDTAPPAPSKIQADDIFGFLMK